MKIKIRKASIDDLGILSDLNREVQSLHHQIDPVLFKSANAADIKKDIEKFIHDPKGGVLLAIVDDSAQGFISYHEGALKESGLTHKIPMIFIHHMGVLEKQRGKGIGSMLLQSVRKIAEQKGIERIQLDVWTLNLDAKTFFQKRGFRTINEIMLNNI